MESPIVALDNVSLRYASGFARARNLTDAVRNVTLEIAPGTTMGLVGETGSGKSSIATLSLGKVRPTSGDVFFDGKKFRRRSRRDLRGQRQVVLQNPEWSLNPRLRCGTSVAEPLAIEGRLGRRERHALVSAILEKVGVSPAIAHRLPHE